ncbi:RNA-directed DNA polymerase, eukaryota [Tanacetum coccineum]
MVTQTWNDTTLTDSNGMIRFKKKLQILKKEMCIWIVDRKKVQMENVQNLRTKLREIDISLDKGEVNDDLLVSRMSLMNQLHDLKSFENRDYIQKAKIKWAVEGDENSKFFHGVVNRKRANLTGPCPRLGHINYTFPNRLKDDQVTDLENPISRDEIRLPVWGCGEDKSPGRDGFTFEFFRKFWGVVGPDFCIAVEWFFKHASFPMGCNSSFLALIPKSLDPKTVEDFRPISLIGCIYKVVTKILATRLSLVISDLVSDVQTAFLPNRQILDGPFIINELLARCHHKKQQAMIFKVDFAKAYDSVRWDYLDAILNSFGFGSKWRLWIRGTLHSSMASILVNGSPTSEFKFFRGLKQGDPLAPYLFILIMESLHLSFSRIVEEGVFTGIKIDSSVTLSHLFYADDAIFIGEWSRGNLNSITHMLSCFSLLSGLSINLQKSQLLGVRVPDSSVIEAASLIGCSILRTPFKYLGIVVGGNMTSIKSWDDTINKLKTRLSNWKLKTLSIGGRLTLLKSVLGSTPIYNMSLYKVPKYVLNSMESLRRNFFNGIREGERKIAWIKWTKVLASKRNGGLGVSSFYALNRGLLVKWLWRFLSRDNSLWSRFIQAAHGSNTQSLVASYPSLWSFIIKELYLLKSQGVDFFLIIGDSRLYTKFPRLYALENNKDCTVAAKLSDDFVSSYRREVRSGVESEQLSQLIDLLDIVVLSHANDRWVWDLNGTGSFQVKDARMLLDDKFLPKVDSPTRWVKFIPIKLNIFAWKVSLNSLPTRINLTRRGVLVSPISCSICHAGLEDLDHLLFSCNLAIDISRSICKWWDLAWNSFDSYGSWLSWLNSIRMSSNLKKVLEGVFYTAWWSIWTYRNQLLFGDSHPRKDIIFDDIVIAASGSFNRLFIIDRNEVFTYGHGISVDNRLELVTQNLDVTRRLPHKVNQSARGLEINSILCLLCDSSMESYDHLCYSCNVAVNIWSKFRVWCDAAMPIYGLNF